MFLAEPVSPHERSCALSFRRRELDTRAPHVGADEVDEAAVDRAERRRVDRREGLVQRAALQLALPEIDGLALKLLGELLHLRLRVHRDVDAALAREIAQLDLEVVEWRDHRVFGVRGVRFLEPAQQRLGAREPLAVT